MFKFAGGVLKEILIGFGIVLMLAIIFTDKIPEIPSRYHDPDTKIHYTTKNIVDDSKYGVWSFEWNTLIHSVEEELRDDFAKDAVHKNRNTVIPSVNDLKFRTDEEIIENGGEVLTVFNMPIGEVKASTSKIYFRYEARGSEPGIVFREKTRMYAAVHVFDGDQAEIHEYLKNLYEQAIGPGETYSGGNVEEGIFWKHNRSYIFLQKVNEIPGAKPKTYLTCIWKRAEDYLPPLAVAVEKEKNK